MKFIIHSDVLYPVLKKLEIIADTDKKNKMEATSLLYVTVYNNNMRMETFDKSGHSMVANINVDYCGECKRFSVYAHLFSKIVNAYKCLIELSLEGHKLTIKDYNASNINLLKKTEIGVISMIKEDLEYLSVAEKFNGKKIGTIEASLLLKSIGKAKVAASDLDSDLNNLMIEIDGANIDYVSTDNCRVMHISNKNQDMQMRKSLKISKYTANVLGRFLDSDGFVDVYVSDDKILLKWGEMELYAGYKQFEKEFIEKCKEIMNGDLNLKIEVDRNEMIAALNRVGVIDKKSIKYVVLSVDDAPISNITIERGVISKKSSSNGSSVSIPIKKLEGHSVKAAFNIDKLLEGLEALEGENIRVIFYGVKDIVKLCEIKEGNSYVVGPMTVNI